MWRYSCATEDRWNGGQTLKKQRRAFRVLVVRMPTPSGTGGNDFYRSLKRYWFLKVRGHPFRSVIGDSSSKRLQRVGCYSRQVPCRLWSLLYVSLIILRSRPGYCFSMDFGKSICAPRDLAITFRRCWQVAGRHRCARADRPCSRKL